MYDLFGLNTFSFYLSLVFRRFYDPTERLLESFCPLVFRTKEFEKHGTDFRYFIYYGFVLKLCLVIYFKQV